MPMFQLKGKRALVTGGSSGIGASIVLLLAHAGAEVFVADRQPADEFIKEVNSDGVKCHSIFLDVSDVESCATAATMTGAVDIIINNAGIGHVGTITDTTADDLDRLYSTNVRGVFNVSKAYMPDMIVRRSGVILNISSIGGIVGIRDRIAYCTTKFAVVGLTKSMALDHAVDGIRVNCICPGRVETPFVSARLAEYPDPQEAYAEMAATQALGRMARPEEIAAAALYLVSDESAFVTGSALIIDGGWSAGK